MKLTIELVPRTCWYSNVRSNLSPETWDNLQTVTFKAAEYRCEICDKRGNNHPVECHEVWQYDDHKRIQKLDRLIALCPKCHQVKHIGFAMQTKDLKTAIAWLSHVNNISPAQALAYIKHAFQINQIRSQFNWQLDLRILTEQYGIKLDKYGIEQGLNTRA